MTFLCILSVMKKVEIFEVAEFFIFSLSSIGFITYIGQQIRIIKRKILEVFHVLQNIGQSVKIIRRKLVDIACTLQNIYTKSADVLNLLKRKEKKMSAISRG